MGGEAERQISARVRGFPRDLLRNFSGDVGPEEAVASATTEEEDSGEIELSLGLSLGGCFGVDPARKKGIHRSASIATIPFAGLGEPHDPVAESVLKRASSLPAVAEEEQRKRKELQCPQQTEAKRKRSETAPFGVTVDAPHGWGTSAAVDGAWGFASMPQGSLGSQGSSSSGLSDYDSWRPKQEDLGNGTDESRSPSSMQPLPALTEHYAPSFPVPSAVPGKPVSRAAAEAAADPSKKLPVGIRGNRMMRDMMEEMPCVSARGDGPNGRRVEGFLYRYGKGGEVRIVCVCHGRFLSPADFVKHAGGGDVAHPLRHIVVKSSFS